jgi:hypothetical protein
MVNAQMTDINPSRPENKPCSIQLDRETWQQLAGLCTRIVGTFGLIEPVLELAQDENEAEKLRRLRLIKYLSQTGHRALKQFARLWTEMDEQFSRNELHNSNGEFDDLLREVRQNPVLETGHQEGEEQSMRSPRGVGHRAVR